MASEYELLRLKNIERNNNYLKEIGITQYEEYFEVKKVKQKPKKRNFEEALEVNLRRSTRVALNPKVSYEVSRICLSHHNSKYHIKKTKK